MLPRRAALEFPWKSGIYKVYYDFRRTTSGGQTPVCARRISQLGESIARLGSDIPNKKSTLKRGKRGNAYDSNDCEPIPRRRDDLRGTDGHFRFFAWHR